VGEILFNGLFLKVFATLVVIKAIIILVLHEYATSIMRIRLEVY